ncbi:MAG: hemolysin family protein [Brevinema sp.]
MMDFILAIDRRLALIYFAYSALNFCLSGFFGCSETVFLSLNRILLYARQNKGNLGANILIYLVERSSQFLTGIVILNNVTLILSTLFMSKMFIEAFHVPLFWVPVWTTLVMTPFILIFAEVLPKSIGHPFADILAERFAYLWMLLYIVMYPLSWCFRKITIGFAYLFGFHEKVSQGMAQNEFQGLLDISLKSGALNTGEREFINNVLEFREVQASEAMTPLSQLVCIEKTQTVYLALDLMKEHQVSILPVYDSRIDNPIGWIRTKDLINAHAQNTVEAYVIEAFFVPETAYLEKVLIQMQKQNMPLAFVADEYGGIVGVLRVEDIVSEIVGEVIEDGDIEFKNLDDGTILAYGLCDIDDLFEELKLDATLLDSKTLSGFIMEELGRMPKEGDVVFKRPWYFEVLSLQGRRVHEVSIKKGMKKSQSRNGDVI